MATYKIGQILTSTEEVRVKKALSNETVVIPKGNKIIIGPDKLAHHLRNGMIQPLCKDDTVEGYDAEGLATYLTMFLKSHFPLSDMFEDYGIEEKVFKDELEYALDDIGF